MENCSTVMAILIDKRTDAAPKVQEVLTKHGCIISTRLGMHRAGECAEEGLVILHLCGTNEDIEKLENDLVGIHRVDVKKMEVAFED
ncbi:MAG: hypothetical protein ACOCQW_02570 [Halanaerobiaceae bacterium]